jgi:hypothetical protein
MWGPQGENLPKRKILTKRIDIRKMRTCRDFFVRNVLARIYNNTNFSTKPKESVNFSALVHVRIELHNLLVKTILYSIVHV